MATTVSTATPAAAPAVTPERIMQMAWGFAPPLVLEAAIHHHVFDVLENGPKSLDEISRATGASERGLASIMNVLVGLEFLYKNGDEYSLAPESAAFLISGKPSFMGGILRHVSGDLLPAFLHLNEVVRTGAPAQAVNDKKTGAEFFERLVTDIFPLSYGPARELGQYLRLDLMASPVSVLDLAAGSGVWGIALAQSAPHVRVRAVDWPGVIPVTQKTVARFGLADRFTYSAGDLSEADFGTGHHVATLGHILHSEGEARSRALIAKTFKALAPGGTICIQEFLVNADRTGPLGGLIFGVNMLVNTSEGNTFSFEEISSWLEEAGFKEARTLASHGPSPLILANKP
jgi:2-polyprenyl-3-methyl-5-hydroxy-6-metoxy-1,4-benzoquinol methylase